MDEVTQLLTTLDKAVRQTALYGRAHPQAERALKDLNARFREVLRTMGKLSLDVKRTDLEWNGESVLRIEKRENNYIQEMYIDGVRALEFRAGLTPEETGNLVSVFARDVHLYEVKEEDTVTLFWKQGFHHVAYATIDIYANDLNALLNPVADDVTPRDQSEKTYLNRFIGRLVDGRDASLPSASPPGAAAPRGSDRAIASPVPPSLFRPNEAERSALAAEADALGGRNYLAEVGIVFSEVLESEMGTEIFPALMRSYLALVEQFLRSGDLRGATDWLRRLRGLKVDDPAVAADLDRRIEESLAPPVFEAFGERLTRGLSATPEEWKQFLGYLGPGAARAVCHFLPAVTQETLHTLFVDFFCLHPPPDLSPFREQLKHSDWPVVRDMVRILTALVDGREIPEILRPLAVHPHAAVRAEVAAATARCDTADALDIIARALKDPDSSVRSAALHQIAKFPHASYAKPLAEQMADDRFASHDFREKRRYAVALAHCGGASALDFLSRLARADGSDSGREDLRVAALHGIAEMPDRKAGELLRRLASKIFLKRSVREAARQLLARRETAKEAALD